MIDNIRERYGVSSVMTGIELASKGELEPKSRAVREPDGDSKDKIIRPNDNINREIRYNILIQDRIPFACVSRHRAIRRSI